MNYVTLTRDQSTDEGTFGLIKLIVRTRVKEG